MITAEVGAARKKRLDDLARRAHLDIGGFSGPAEMMEEAIRH